MSALQLAVLSLFRRRVPTLITVLSIALAVACGGILYRLYHLSASRFDSIGKGWDAVVGAKAGGIEILLNAMNGEGPYPDFLPYVLYESLHAGQAVHFEDGHDSNPRYLKEVVPFLYFAKFNTARVVASDENFLHGAWSEGSAFTSGAWSQHEDEVVVGESAAREYGTKVGDVISLNPWLGQDASSGEVKMKVSGILRRSGTAWDRMLFTSVQAGQRILAANREALGSSSIWGEHVLSYFLINLHPGGFSQLQNLVNKRTVGQVIQVDREKEKLRELTGAGKSLGIFVSVLIVLLSALSVASLLITRFEAMSVQLAVLRALGNSRREVAKWLLWEGFLLGLGGCILGALLEAMLFPIVRALLGSTVPSPEVVQSSVFTSFPIWLLVLFATTVAIFIPLIRLYRQDVHQALKA